MRFKLTPVKEKPKPVYSPYEKGLVYCCACLKYFKPKGSRCPICRGKVRTMRKYLKGKREIKYAAPRNLGG